MSLQLKCDPSTGVGLVFTLTARDSLIDAHVGTALSAKEQELLWNAVKDPGGRITHIKAIGRDLLSVNNQIFPETRDPRSVAEWFGAMRLLERRGLLEGVGVNRDFFRVTDNGYALSDELGEFVRWHAQQITLEARYMNAPTEMVTLVCKRIMRLGPEYLKDQIGADGLVMRTLKERRSLLVEDIDPRDVKEVGWEPTDVSFIDEKSGRAEHFLVGRRIPTGPLSLRFPILD